MTDAWKKARKHLVKDEYIGPLIRKYGPCEIVKKPENEYFDRLVRAVVGQQLSTKAAATIYKRLSEKLGGVTPDKVLKVRKSSLGKCGLSNAKSDYIKDLAKHVKDGALEIERLDDFNDDKVMEELVAVKGIGPWTAEMFLMFTLARPDIFPVDDLGIRNGMKKLLGKELSQEKMVEFAKRWAPYRTYASYYIWELLDNK